MIPVVVNVSLSHSSANDIYTVSCVAHFAFPPVDLVWVKGKLFVSQHIMMYNWPVSSNVF